MTLQKKFGRNYMKIAIDARLYGLKHAGIGRYVQNLLTQLSQIDQVNHYQIITSEDSQLTQLPNNHEIIKVNIKHYSLNEQLKLAYVINKLDADLVHYPHFNVPLLARKPYVLTIHDLLWHDRIGFDVTTLPKLQYLVKYAGYRFTISQAIKKSLYVITPADFVRNQVIKRFHKNHSKVVVTSEAADQLYHQTKKVAVNTTSLGVKKPFVVYTGSLYPHKNVLSLVQALAYVPSVDLVVSSARNVFAENFTRDVAKLGLSHRVKMLGFVDDLTLLGLYQQALALVQPSQSEGFGLTGLEAMASGLPVICSHNSVMYEVYGKAALFVDTTQPTEIAQSINRIMEDRSLRLRLKSLGTKQASKYSWSKTAEETLELYQKAHSLLEL